MVGRDRQLRIAARTRSRRPTAERRVSPVHRPRPGRASGSRAWSGSSSPRSAAVRRCSRDAACPTARASRSGRSSRWRSRPPASRRTTPPERARAELRELLEGDDRTARPSPRTCPGMLGLDGSGPVEPPWAVRRFLEALGTAATAGRRVRRHPLGRADVARGDRARRRVVPRRPDPARLHGPARAPGGTPGWGGGQRNATSVHLEPLSEPEADALIENLLGHPPLTPDDPRAHPRRRQREPAVRRGDAVDARRRRRPGAEGRRVGRHDRPVERAGPARDLGPARLAPGPTLARGAAGRRGRGGRGRGVRPLGGARARPRRERADASRTTSAACC